MTPWTVAHQDPLSMERARILEWIAIPFSRGSSQPTDWTWVSCIAGRLFTDWATGNTYNCLAVTLFKSMIKWSRKLRLALWVWGSLVHWTEASVLNWCQGGHANSQWMSTAWVVYLTKMSSCCSVARSCLTLCDPMDCSMSVSSVLLYLSDFAQFLVPWVSDANYHILCHPLLLLPSIFPSIKVFSNELTFRIRWLKSCSFSFSVSPSNEYSGFIFFGIDWFDLLEAQGTLKSLLQHHNLKASVLQHSAFFMVQLSHLYMSSA